MDYGKEPPTQEGYYWVRGVVMHKAIDRIVFVDKVSDGFRTSLLDATYRDVTFHKSVEWAGPIPHPGEMR